jgi:regulator of sigma E protease
MTSHLPLVGFILALTGLLGFLKSAALYILAFGFVFGLLAFAHEFGHFITAKMLGMSVDQFGIGFPPTHGWTIMRRSGTSYTIHPIPLGAFVRIHGMDPGDQDSPNSFLRKPPWARLIVLVAGSAANMLLAVLIFMLMGVTTGVPVRDYVTNKVKAVTPDSAAQKAGLRPGDRVLGVRPAGTRGEWVRAKPQANGEYDATNIVDLIHRSHVATFRNGKSVIVGTPLAVQIQHSDGSNVVVTATPSYDVALGNISVLGYRPVGATEYRSATWIEAPAEGIDQARQRAVFLVKILFSQIMKVVMREITPSQFSQDFTGPIGIASASGEIARAGWPDFLSFVGMLSINLAVLNLFPLPIFDGGNIILNLLEVARRKQLEPRQFMIVQLVGVAFILTLFVVLTYNDLVRLAHGSTLP